MRSTLPRLFALWRDHTLIWRLAWRDLRGISGGLRLLATALVLAVAALAAVGSIADGLLEGVRAGSRQAIGGDLSFRLFHRPPTAAERDFLTSFGELDEVAELRVRAARIDGAAATLVELKAIEATYPLFGDLVVDPPLPPGPTLAANAAGVWPAAVDDALLGELALDIGDRLRLGALELEIRARLLAEPDRALRAFALGPRVLISQPALAASGLATPGAAVYWYSRLRLAPGTDSSAVVAAVESRFPHAGWRIVDAADGIPGIERSLALARALVLALALAILVIGGVGIGGAVTAHLDRKTRTIAMLKTLGASGRQTAGIYLTQLLLVAAAAMLAGMLLGGLVATAIHGFGLDRVPGDAWTSAFQPRALALAGAMGLVTTLLFAVLPLGRAIRASPAQLLGAQRAGPWTGSGGSRPGTLDLRAHLAAVALALTLGGLVVAASDLPVASAAVLAALLASATLLAGWARLLVLALRRLRPALGQAPRARLALAGLTAPSAPTTGAITAIGLGLTALVAVLSLQILVARHLAATLPATAPDLVLINLHPANDVAIADLAAADRRIAKLRLAPFLHARITHLDGVPVRELAIPADIAWVIRGDRGVSWAWPQNAAEAVPTTAAAQPWRASLAQDVASRLGLAPGGRLTLDLQGRAVELTVVTHHVVDWTRLDLDFPILLEPPAEPPPHRLVAALWLQQGGDTEAVAATLGDRFPDAPVIVVADVLAGIAQLVGVLGRALASVSLLTLAAACLVLAGGIAAGYRRRARAVAVLTSQGVTRRQLAAAAALELGFMGLAAALPAGLLGSLAAWLVAARIGPDTWQLDLAVPFGTGLAVVVVLAAIGYALPPRRLAWREHLD